MTPAAFTIIGRSSSSFTRTVRIFAAELAVPYAFEIVRDLQSMSVEDYGGNPALKLPSLRTPQATWFGSLNICRELARLAERPRHLVWPESLAQPLLANAQELVLQAMSTEVGLIMSGLAGQPDTPHRRKMARSLDNVLSWLDAHLEQTLAALPRERDVSYLEVTLFCLIDHLDFRKVVSTAPHAQLTAFRDAFGTRAACRETEYRFDT